ncbi:MAG: hypothetical protein PSX36_04560 [bacterium]|nr:hypothetical protein [bacterium]
MKNLLFITMISATLISSSCRKTRTCNCTTLFTDIRSGNNPETTQNSTSLTFTEAKQKANEFKYGSNCFSHTGTDTRYGGSGTSSYTVVSIYETKCELK